MLCTKYFLLLCIALLASSCKQPASPPTEQFKQQWCAGKAELTSYSLLQSRYGEMRKGEAVLIFVTEDFSTKKLVKLDEPEKTSNKVRVLKMNFTKKFFTGIYPYSMMVSVFTPVDESGNEQTLKANCSSQEWCGHTFSQLKLSGNNYLWQLHSYFQQEGNQEKKVNATMLEDELWNRIRLNPAVLPQGKISLIPSLLWQRLSHMQMQQADAQVTLSAADTGFIKVANASMYTIQYPSLKRTLKIYFSNSFPHEILGWQDEYPDGFGATKKMLTTQAVRKKTLWLDYWKHNSNADSSFRDSLQLMRYE